MSTIKVDTIQTRGGVSEIAIDKLKGVTTTDVIQVTTGSTTTSLQDGMAKVYSRFSLTDGSEGFKGTNSLNNATFTDGGPGVVSFTLTTNFADANYAIVVSSNATRSNSALNANALTSDKNGMYLRNDAGTFSDFDDGCCISHGDLA